MKVKSHIKHIKLSKKEALTGTLRQKKKRPSSTSDPYFDIPLPPGFQSFKTKLQLFTNHSKPNSPHCHRLHSRYR